MLTNHNQEQSVNAAIINLYHQQVNAGCEVVNKLYTVFAYTPCQLFQILSLPSDISCTRFTRLRRLHSCRHILTRTFNSECKSRNLEKDYAVIRMSYTFSHE